MTIYTINPHYNPRYKSSVRNASSICPDGTFYCIAEENKQINYVSTYALQWDVLFPISMTMTRNIVSPTYNALAMSVSDNVACWATYATDSRFRTSSFAGSTRYVCP